MPLDRIMLSTATTPLKVDFLMPSFTEGELNRSYVVSTTFGEDTAGDPAANVQAALVARKIYWDGSPWEKWRKSIAGIGVKGVTVKDFCWYTLSGMYDRDNELRLLLVRRSSMAGSTLCRGDYVYSMVKGKNWQSVKKKWLAETSPYVAA